MLTKQGVHDLLEGLAILGTGGGGSPEWGRRILENDLDRGRQPTLVDPSDVPDAATVASGGFMGSVKILDRMDPVELVERWERRFELSEAFKVMEATIGRGVDYVVAFEMGGLNTPVILSLGARTGIPVVDGDGLGRAAPETQMVSFIGHGVSLTPMPLVDAEGNVVVVRHGVENTYPDVLGRWVVSRGGGMGANAHYPMSGADLKRSVIPHTITKAEALGRDLRSARELGRDPLSAVVAHLQGHHVHSAAIQSIQEDEWQGFYFTRVALEGGVNITIKNETMALFVDGQPATIFPDLICMLDPATGRGLMSVDLKVGDEVAIVVAACHPRLRQARASQAGRVAFSPARFGQPDLVYEEVESLLAKLSRTPDSPPKPLAGVGEPT
ncbi:MAG TPA: DUF917 domain-containing protein [Anaerolineales bacterium]|nr:DUF917 domain-containing protein [Anaerolineales bacterium]